MLEGKFWVNGNSIQNVRTRACTSSNKALRRRVFACVNGRPRPVNSPAEPACSRRSPVAEPNTARRQKRVESPRRRLHPVLPFSTLSLLSLLFRDSLPTPSVPLLPITFFSYLYRGSRGLSSRRLVTGGHKFVRRSQEQRREGGAANLCVWEAESGKGRGVDSGFASGVSRARTWLHWRTRPIHHSPWH